VGVIVTPNADDDRLGVEQTVARQVGERRHQLSPSEVAAGAKDDHGAASCLAHLRFGDPLVRERCRRNDRRAHAECTACPPNSWRKAAITLAPNDSDWRERSRVSSDNVITGAGTSRSIASCTVQRPSPESSTQPLRSASDASREKAVTASSLSHDRTTLPCCHTSEICSRSSFGKIFDACRISYPSAYACSNPYSMPLCTILT